MAVHYYDAHNHLQDEGFIPHLDSLFTELHTSDVAGMVVNGTAENDWPAVTVLADRARWIIPSYGLHPWDCGNRSPDWYSLLRQYILAKPNAAIGEIGIDNWILEKARPDDPRLLGLRRASLDEQCEVFEQQLALACEFKRPLSIHCLAAWDVLLRILRAAKLPERGFLLHAYGGPADRVASFADLGAYFSFNGSFLDPRRKRLHEAYRRVPIERLLMETDAPAMIPPEPWRRQELPNIGTGTSLNHPGNIVSIYEGYSATFGITMDLLTRRCGENFARLFAPLSALP